MDGPSTRLASHEDLTNGADARGPDEQQRTDAEETDRLPDFQPRARVGYVQEKCDRHHW